MLAMTLYEFRLAEEHFTRLTFEHFHVPIHRTVLGGVLSLRAASQDVGPVSVAVQLERFGVVHAARAVDALLARPHLKLRTIESLEHAALLRLKRKDRTPDRIRDEVSLLAADEERSWAEGYEYAVNRLDRYVAERRNYQTLPKLPCLITRGSRVQFANVNDDSIFTCIGWSPETNCVVLSPTPYWEPNDPDGNHAPLNELSCPFRKAPVTGWIHEPESLHKVEAPLRRFADALQVDSRVHSISDGFDYSPIAYEESHDLEAHR